MIGFQVISLVDRGDSYKRQTIRENSGRVAVVRDSTEASLLAGVISYQGNNLAYRLSRTKENTSTGLKYVNLEELVVFDPG